MSQKRAVASAIRRNQDVLVPLPWEVQGCRLCSWMWSNGFADYLCEKHTTEPARALRDRGSVIVCPLGEPPLSNRGVSSENLTREAGCFAETFPEEK